MHKLYLITEPLLIILHFGGNLDTFWYNNEVKCWQYKCGKDDKQPQLRTEGWTKFV